MKKFTIILVACLLLLCSCRDEVLSVDTNPKSKISVAYSLDELNEFFQGSNYTEMLLEEGSSITITKEDVLKRFPAEEKTNQNYVVYKVKEGGLYYVFWIDSMSAESMSEENVLVGRHQNEVVYFYSYCNGVLKAEDFNGITPMVSTAGDVKRIDPGFELCLYMSHGVYSYSLLADGNVLEVEYQNTSKITGYEDLIVLSTQVVPRKNTPSQFSLL